MQNMVDLPWGLTKEHYMRFVTLVALAVGAVAVFAPTQSAADPSLAASTVYADPCTSLPAASVDGPSSDGGQSSGGQTAINFRVLESVVVDGSYAWTNYGSAPRCSDVVWLAV